MDGSLSEFGSPDAASTESPLSFESHQGPSNSPEELALARRQKQPEVADPKSQRSVDDTLDWLKHNVSQLITLVSDQLAKNSAVYEPVVEDLKTSNGLLSQESNAIRALHAGLTHKVGDLHVAQDQLAASQKSLRDDVNTLNVDFLTLHKDVGTLHDSNKSLRKTLSEFVDYQRYTDENILLLADLEKKVTVQDDALSRHEKELAVQRSEVERHNKELSYQRSEIGKQNSVIAAQKSSISHNAMDLRALSVRVQEMKDGLVQAVKNEVDDEMARQRFIHSLPPTSQTTTNPASIDKSTQSTDKPPDVVPPDITTSSETSKSLALGMLKAARKPQITFLPGTVTVNPPAQTTFAYPTHMSDEAEKEKEPEGSRTKDKERFREESSASVGVEDEMEARTQTVGVYAGRDGILYAELGELVDGAIFALMNAPPKPTNLDGRWELTTEKVPRWYFRQAPLRQVSSGSAEPPHHHTQPKDDERRARASGRNHRDPSDPSDDSDSHHRDNESKRRRRRSRSRSRSRGRSRRRNNSRHSRRRSHSHSRSSRSGKSRSRSRSRSRWRRSRSRGRIIKDRPRTIPANQLPTFEPEEGATKQFCDHLKRLAKMHGENSVIAALLSVFTKGRAKAWFASNTMDSDQMSSVDGWIRALRKEFVINTAEAKQKADRRRYDPSKDESVIDYYYDKINLLKSTDYYMDDDKIIDAIWLGLPEDFQIHLHYSEFCRSSLNEVRRMLADKDGSYRKATRRNPPLIGKARSRERRERRWKEKRERDRSANNSPPRSYERSSRSSRSVRNDDKFRKDKRQADKPFKRGGGGSNDNRKKARLSKRDLEKLEKDYPTPANLPKSEWRSDEKGRIMTRKCRFCNQWHYDYDCSQKPESYHLMLMKMDNLAMGEDSDSDGSETMEYSDGYSSSSSEPSHGTYHITPVYSTSTEQTARLLSVKIPKAEKYHIESLPPALAVGTGISYLSVKPCPIRAWIGTEPHSDAELVTGVADTGGPSFIQHSLIPHGFEIRPNPLNPRFRGIGEGETSTKGYVVLPVWLPNAAALSGDQKHAKVLLIWCEFQVIDSLGANYLIGRDALHPYGVNINEQEGHLLFPQCKPPVKIPILDGPSRFASKLSDNQVYCSNDFTIRPREQRWIPIYFERPSHSDDLLLSAKRFPDKANGTYPICPYAVMNKDTDHILFFNPGKRPSRYKKGDVVGQFDSVALNTPYSHFNLPGIVPATPSSAPLEASFSVSSIAPELVDGLRGRFTGASSTVHKHSTTNIIPVPPPKNSVTPSVVQSFDVNTLSNGLNNKQDLEWFPGVSPESTVSMPAVPANSIGKPSDQSDKPPLEPSEPFGRLPGPTIPSDVLVTIDEVDPFGLQHEFRGEGPLDDRAGNRNDDIGWRESDLSWDINPVLNRRQRRAILKMLRKHIKVFAGPEGRLGRVDSRFDMDIEGDLKDIKSQQPYRTSPDKQKHIKDAINTLSSLDVIQPSNSSVASPVIVVIQHGKPRFCVDLREVNSKIAADRYALPKQDMIFAALLGALFFTILDANRGYHQFGLTLCSRKFTAFTTDFGLFEFKRVPFGLKTAPAHFQRAIDIILGSMRWDFALAYIDDIIVYSKTLEEHIGHIAAVLEALLNAGMTLAETKCHFGYQDIKLLGHRISRLGLSTLEEKVQAILAIQYPETIKQAMVILGMFNYYRNFIDSFAIIAAPLYDGLKGSLKDTSLANLSPKAKAKVRSRWRFPDTPDCRKAFQRLKDALSNAPTLIHPDFSREFILYCDACRKGIAAILQQISPLDDKEHPICYISRRLNASEYHYASTKLECLAIVWALDKLSHYVDGSQLKLVTDHSALKWIWNVKPGVNARLFRWSLILNPLRDRVTIIHRPGKLHSNVDPLSRNPAGYSVTLIKMSDDWEQKLAKEYQDDPYYRRIIKELLKIQEEGEAAKQRMVKRNNKKFEKAVNKAQEMDKEKDKDAVEDLAKDKARMDEDGTDMAKDKAEMKEIVDSKAGDKAAHQKYTPTAPTSNSSIRDDAVTAPPSIDDVNVRTNKSQSVTENPIQKSGDLSRTAISPVFSPKKATSSGHQSKSSEHSLVDSSADVVSSSPKEVDVDGKEKNVFRIEAEVYANELDGNDELVDGLDLPDDMPEQIALDEALDDALEEANRDGIVEPVLDVGEENGPVDELMGDVAGDEKKLDEFVDEQRH